MTHTTIAKRAAIGWYECGAFRDSTHPAAKVRRDGERGFELKLHERQPDAPLSPFYLMLRTPENPGKPGPLTSEVVADSAAALYQLVTENEIPMDCICGLPHAGDPFAHDFMVVDRYHNRHIATLQSGPLRLDKEVTAIGRRVVGPPKGLFVPGQRVIVIDDLVTAGDTKLEGINVLEQAGLVVSDILVLVDREQGGAECLRAAGYRVHALFTLTSLLEFYHEKRLIGDQLHQKIIEYAGLT